MAALAPLPGLKHSSWGGPMSFELKHWNLKAMEYSNKGILCTVGVSNQVLLAMYVEWGLGKNKLAFQIPLYMCWCNASDNSNMYSIFLLK